MTQHHEKLSALVDGEIQDPELVKNISADSELLNKWKHYHLIREGLRSEPGVDLSFDISEKVASMLDNELSIVAPKVKYRWQDAPVIGSVIPLLKQSGQFAVAASVAAVMILTYQQVNQPEVTQPFLTAQPEFGAQGGAAPVSMAQTRQTGTAPRNDMASLLEQRRQINALITDHQQQLRLRTVGISVIDESSTTEVDTTTDPDTH